MVGVDVVVGADVVVEGELDVVVVAAVTGGDVAATGALCVHALATNTAATAVTLPITILERPSVSCGSHTASRFGGATGRMRT